MGPTVQVMPAPNKPFDVFQQDEAYCKSVADSQVAGQVESANNQAVGAGVVGTLLGAGIGAAAGGGRGAGLGAAVGAGAGTAVGANQSERAQYGIQAQYNNAYAQCMYSRGNQVPGAAPPPPVYYTPQPPPPGYAPPPPPGYAPPPPGYYPPPR